MPAGSHPQNQQQMAAQSNVGRPGMPSRTPQPMGGNTQSAGFSRGAPMMNQGPPSQQPMLEKRTSSTADDSMHSNYGYATSSKQQNSSPLKPPSQSSQP